MVFYHLSLVSDAHFGLQGQGFDLQSRGLAVLGGCGGNFHQPAIVDLNFGVGFALNGPDHLSPWANDITDFVRINLNRNNFGRKRRNVFPWCGEGFQHFIQDVHPPDLGLGQCLFHNVTGKFKNFDIHLQGRDTFGGYRSP